MKKILLLAVILMPLALVYLNSQFGLLSQAGFDDKGLPAKKVVGSLRSNPSGSDLVIDHTPWSSLLGKHVTSKGQVNYKGFLADKAALEAYLSMLAEQAPTQSWSVQQQLAYYINAYNAWTVYLILENYPVKSIKDIPGAWTQEIVKIGDTHISLGGLEHSILRKMNEPRIHFAINCASASCPILWNKAYEAEELNAQLDRAAREFINSERHNTISPEKIELSKIFKWYKNDFPGGDLITYINRFSKVTIDPDAKVTFRAYDWQLNKLAP